MYWGNGCKSYEGSFKGGEFSGCGKKYGEGGKLVYDGYSSLGKKYFKGKKFDEEGGIKFEGESVADKAYGHGVSYHDNGKMEYKGYWENGAYCGGGVLYHYNGVKNYEGNFRANKFHGFGERFDYAGNLLCRCKWNENKIESFCVTVGMINFGFDILDMSESCFYVGVVKKGKPSGFGTEWVKSTGQKRYEGNYSDGFFHGFGKGFYDNTENQPHPIYIGYWNEGKIFFGLKK